MNTTTLRSPYHAMRQILLTVMLLLCITPIAPAYSQAPDIWSSLAKSEVFAIMRHAIAPGFGDPPDFDINDCTKQRNLSAEGQDQAMRAAKLFRQYGMTDAAVYSSQWCRCRETARLLGLGKVNDLTALNSFFQKYERRAAQTAGLKAWLSRLTPGQPYVLVTHQVNISALLGRGARSGEIIFIRQTQDGGFQIEGSIIP